MQYSINKTTGENIAWSLSNITASHSTKKWYNEIEEFDFDQPGYSSQTSALFIYNNSLKLC